MLQLAIALRDWLSGIFGQAVALPGGRMALC